MNNDILGKLGITLNAMQEATADAVLHTGKDVVVMSPTGSGKTYAYLLPLIQRLDTSSDELQAVVLVPGRELALQSANVLKDMGSGLRSMPLYGGRPTMEEHRVLRDVKPQIVFATPGRLNDHLDKSNINAATIKPPATASGMLKSCKNLIFATKNRPKINTMVAKINV